LSQVPMWKYEGSNYGRQHGVVHVFLYALSGSKFNSTATSVTGRPWNFV
jgi:hypothetical protein